MNDNTDNQLREDFRAYKKIKEELATRLEENKQLQQEINETRGLKRIFAHELKNPLNGIVGMISLIENRVYSSEEERNNYFEMLYKSVEKINNLVGILYLDGSSKEELQKKAEVLALEEIAKRHAFINDIVMKKEKIGLHLKYNKAEYNKPIEIYTNKAVVSAVWGTLFNNSLAWAPELSRITQGFRINKADNLEIIMENVYAEKRLREDIGLGEGIGTPFVKNIIKTLNGNFQTYKNISQIKKDYDIDEWWGYKETKRTDQNEKLYGVKVTIPLKELKAPEEKTQ